MIISENPSTENGWKIFEHQFIEEKLVAAGSNFLTSNG